MSRHSRTRARLDPYHLDLRVQGTPTLAPYLQARVGGTGPVGPVGPAKRTTF